MKVSPRGRYVPENNSIMIQYEAEVPKERLRISDGEHVHSYGVIFEYGGAEKNVIVCERKAKFVERKSMTVSKLLLSFPNSVVPNRILYTESYSQQQKHTNLPALLQSLANGLKLRIILCRCAS